jgi:hypothetical protein
VNGCEKLRAVFRIAIQPEFLYRPVAHPLADRWKERLTSAGHDVQLVSVRDPGFLERIATFDAFLWWFPPVLVPRELGKRLLTALDHATNVMVLPDWRSCWHFDDKIAQTYLLRAAGIPMPETTILWSYDEAIEFCRAARYPLVIKLSSGYRAENVGLLRNRAEAERMARRLFGAGVSSLRPRRFETLRDATRPLRSWFGERVGRPPLSPPALQRDSMLVQEFAAGNDFDTRVNVIGERALAFRRGNRPNDFRASGGGRNDTDSGIDTDVIRLAFRTAQALRMRTLAVDVLRLEGKPVVTEVSYHFEPALMPLYPGHWRLDGETVQWIDGSMRVDDVILDDFIDRLTSFRNKS